MIRKFFWQFLEITSG